MCYAFKTRIVLTNLAWIETYISVSVGKKQKGNISNSSAQEFSNPSYDQQLNLSNFMHRLDANKQNQNNESCLHNVSLSAHPPPP